MLGRPFISLEPENAGRDFARCCEVADRLHGSSNQIRKVLAGAHALLGIASRGQLARFLTACELMGTKRQGLVVAKSNKPEGEFGSSSCRRSER
jgi:hypothetical protein